MTHVSCLSQGRRAKAELGPRRRRKGKGSGSGENLIILRDTEVPGHVCNVTVLPVSQATQTGFTSMWWSVLWTKEEGDEVHEGQGNLCGEIAREALTTAGALLPSAVQSAL
jgi:hypothetical protein